MSEGDYVGAIENYDEGLEYRRDCKALWTNKALAELKVFRCLPQALAPSKHRDFPPATVTKVICWVLAFIARTGSDTLVPQSFVVKDA